MKKLFKGITCLVVIVSLLAIPLVANAEPAFKKYELGAKKETASSLRAANKLVVDESKASVPAELDFSSKMPAVQDQGTLGACTGFAGAYLKSLEEYDDQGWGKKMMSPSFIYNQINGGQPTGTSPYDAVELMFNKGDCKLSSMPYSDTDWVTQPNASQLAEAANFKARDYGVLVSDGFSAATVDDLKIWMDSQQDGAILNVPVYPSFDAGDFDSLSGSSRGQHAVCLVGYNDSTQRLKFINSWGTAYGSSGYGYISYAVWDQLVSQNAVWTYAMIDEKTGPINPKPKYKYTLKFTDARVVETGSHSAGNQWGFAVKNESKSTTVIYRRQNTSNPITTDKSIQTNYDGCYVGFHEYDTKYDDYFKKVYTHLDEGENVLYCVVRDKQYKDYWTKWRVKVERIVN